MSAERFKEIDLEQAIEDSLVGVGGYIKGNPLAFNRETALDEQTLIQFVKNTQPREWQRYEHTYPTDTEHHFIKRFCEVVKQEGLLKVLRHGMKDRGISFKLCYFKPANDMNKTTLELYDKNILHCTRQLHYSVSNENSIDVVLFLNGIPVVSMELKNQFTGQDVDNAINQYKFDRATKDKLFEFKQRVFVHFAVDLYNVAMTTKLAGANTFFLPFNQGSNGAGNDGGRGNPANSDGFPTAYLWERVLCKDKLLEIIQKFLHLEKTKDKKTGKIKETFIFPRYHQLDVVTKLVADARQNGAGHNYLVQHSAGSGKSNSIAWLAYQLSSLHNAGNEKIFNSVIVLTDRRVLDGQLQDTIYQFEHKDGVVKPIKNTSAELRDAINEGTPIVISTLQKFPRIYKELVTSGKQFAIIIDEAHSSQSGRAASTVIEGLADIEQQLQEYAQQESEAEDKRKDSIDELTETLAAQGPQPNLSFFAFTATPKSKTLQRFGTKQSDGSFKAFHIYSMRQAIEEGFILDVLANYTTYKTYYNVVKKTTDDPKLNTTKGAKAIARFQALHPHNIAQKTQIMIEHFHDITMNKINGRAKAMVVTASRLQALLYLQEFRKYIKQQHYEKDIDVLVAFSGDLTKDGITYTEESLNKDKHGKTIKEKQLPAFFKEDFNILIVADKYQTGFDEPLLHTMFVDKKLNDVKAVQTLSRLNRTTAGKTDTFILDFVNEREDIQKSFQPYYQATNLESETDPNELYKMKATLDDMHVYGTNEVYCFADMFYSGKGDGKTMGKMASYLKPAQDRFYALTEEQQDTFKKVLNNYVRMYGFIIQVVRMGDEDLQKFYIYSKFLGKVLRTKKQPAVNLDDKLMLEYYKLEKVADGAIELKKEPGQTQPLKGGTGTSKKKEEPLSALIEKFNQRFGTNFTGQHKVLEQTLVKLSQDEYLQSSVKQKNKTAFDGLFTEKFTNAMLDIHDENDKFFAELFKDADKMEFLKHLMAVETYNHLLTE